MKGLPSGAVAESLPAHARDEMQETGLRSLGQEDPLEKGMATHSRILAEEPGRLQFIGLQESDTT